MVATDQSRIIKLSVGSGQAQFEAGLDMHPQGKTRVVDDTQDVDVGKVHE